MAEKRYHQVDDEGSEDQSVGIKLSVQQPHCCRLYISQTPNHDSPPPIPPVTLRQASKLHAHFHILPLYKSPNDENIPHLVAVQCREKHILSLTEILSSHMSGQKCTVVFIGRLPFKRWDY
jgi:hypothetical protein